MSGIEPYKAANNDYYHDRYGQMATRIPMLITTPLLVKTSKITPYILSNISINNYTYTYQTDIYIHNNETRSNSGIKKKIDQLIIIPLL